MAAHAAQLSAAAAAKKDAGFAAAAAASRLAAKEEEKKIEQALKIAKERCGERRQDLESVKKEVESTAKELRAGADRLCSDFEQHQQMVNDAHQQLADSEATFALLLLTAQQVQQAGDFDANLKFAQLQRDSQPLHVQVERAVRNSGRDFHPGMVSELKAMLSLSCIQRQSLILGADPAAELVSFCRGLELKTQSELLYRASRDGFRRVVFVRCCANKGLTLTLVKVAGNNFVFGAYTRCSWPAVSGVVADPTGRSFLFSLVNAGDKAVRFNLHVNDSAIELAEDIGFGAGKWEGGKKTGCPSFILMYQGRSANQQNANAANPMTANKAYQSDGGRVCDATFLAGQQLFAAAEIEVFQL